MTATLIANEICVDCGRTLSQREAAFLFEERVMCTHCHHRRTHGKPNASTPPAIPVRPSVRPCVRVDASIPAPIPMPTPVPTRAPTPARVPVLAYRSPTLPTSTSAFRRDGKTLVITRDAANAVELPNRCIKCNAAATWRKTSTLQWAPPAVYLIGGPIVALLFMKRAKVSYCLCEAHRRKRAANMRIGVVLGILCPVLFAAGGALCVNPSTDAVGAALIIAAVLAMMAAIILPAVAAAVLRAADMDKTHARLRGAGPEFLASLPD